MATSIIKHQPLINVVTESGTTNETWSAKLNKLFSACDGLSVDKKRNSMLIEGGAIFRCTDTTGQYYTQVTISQFATYIINMIINQTDSKRYMTRIDNNSHTISFTDETGTLTTKNLVLAYTD